MKVVGAEIYVEDPEDSPLVELVVKAEEVEGIKDDVIWEFVVELADVVVFESVIDDEVEREEEIDEEEVVILEPVVEIWEELVFDDTVEDKEGLF